VLLPFGDHIIYDSLVNAYNVTFGKGIRNDLDRIYKDAKERNAITTSLVPSEPVSREEREKDDLTTNEKVLEAFRTHLYRIGLSSKVVETGREQPSRRSPASICCIDPSRSRCGNSTLARSEGTSRR